MPIRRSLATPSLRRTLLAGLLSTLFWPTFFWGTRSWEPMTLHAPELQASEGDFSDWAPDIELLIEFLEENHPAPYHRNSRETWRRAASDLEKKLRSCTRDQAILGFQALIALAGDGHSRIRVPSRYQRSRKWFPIHTHAFSDGLYLRTAHRDYAPYFGQKIVAVNGVPIGEVFQRILPLIGYDNMMGALNQFPHHLRSPWSLHATGITPDVANEVVITFENSDEKRTDAKITANHDSWITREWVDADFQETKPKPLHRTADGNYSFTYVEKEKLAYLYFDSVRNDQGESLADFCRRVFALVEERDVEKLVLDIRENSGGNNYLNQPLVHGLIRCEKINRPGRLFVITGRDTFSAAMCLSVELERNTHALFVGEPPGATPNHFGDSEEFTLPNSRLIVRCSALYWQNSDPRDRRPWITPDLHAETSFSDFKARRDPALEKILAHSENVSDPVPAPNTRWTRENQKTGEEALRTTQCLAGLLGRKQ